ncbi:hypothetical protein N9A22_01810 [Methylophilaceae bacterium]|nr:hypothetical protein [Methylophilaceae bacterium]
MTSWLLVSTLPAFSFIFMQLSGIFANHYAGVTGWVEMSWARVLRQLNSNMDTIINWGGQFSLYFIITVLVLSIFIYCFATIRYLLIEPNSTKVEPSRSELLIIFLGILIIGFFTTILPSLFVVGSHPRYFCGPLLFVFCQFFVLIQLLIQKFPHKAIYILSIIASFGIAVSSVSALYQSHLDSYEEISKSQKVLRSFLEVKKDVFKNDSQVLIILDDNTFDSTVSFNHWSSHLVKHITKRQDIIALIGPKKNMTINPFIINGDYYEMSGIFWHTVNGRTKRKKMVGLDVNRPTYIYKQVDGGFKEYSCIVVNSKEDNKVYNFINNKHVLPKQNNLQPRDMDSDCVFYSSQ